MTTSMKAFEQYIRGFEDCSCHAMIRDLSALEPEWRWETPSQRAGGPYVFFKFDKHPLRSISIVNAEHSRGIVGIAKRDVTCVNIIFVLAGEVQTYDRHSREIVRVPVNHVATISGKQGERLQIGADSSWLLLQIPSSVLRGYFEELTGMPYGQRFILPPALFQQHDVDGLYAALRQAERDLSTATQHEKTMLAKAYEQLALVKLFVRLPHNMVEAFNHGAVGDMPRQLLRAEAFMRDNLYNKINLNDVAKAAGCSRRALQRMFHTYRRETPTAILCSYRLAAAHGAIRAGQAESVIDLALSLNFSNPGRFALLYKNAYGSSPSFNLRFNRESRNESKGT